MTSARSIASAVALLVLAGCGRPTPPDVPAATELPPAKVDVTAVRAETVSTFAEITGTVRPERRAQVAAKVMGAIADMPVVLGQNVRAGDLLARIDAGEISARVVQAQAQLSAARRDLERERELLTKGASTADMVRGLEDRFDGAQAMVREAEVMLDYTKVRAPFDGVVARKLANAGDLASPGYPLLEIEGTADFRVEAGIPASLARALSNGAPVLIELPSSGKTIEGRLTEMSSSADPDARTVEAKIAVPAGTAVRSGEFARVRVPGAPVRMLLVPASAVATLGQMQRVFVAGDGNRAVLRIVKTGAMRGDRVEVLAGLDEGDKVVVAPPPGLRDGQRLEIPR